MDNKLLWMNYDFHCVQDDLELSALLSPLCSESEMRVDNLFGTQCMQGGFHSNPFYQDTFKDEFDALLDRNNGVLDDIIMETSQTTMLKEEDMKIVHHNTNEGSTMSKKRTTEERVLTLEEVSQYFYMPIIEAAKELNVGLTLLKKKCREVGIPRWPYRQMKSMQTLINNLQELGWEEGSVGDLLQVQNAIDMLQQEQMLMEVSPSVQMKEDTKRLRQACFKARYKKRRLMAGMERDL